MREMRAIIIAGLLLAAPLKSAFAQQPKPTVSSANSFEVNAEGDTVVLGHHYVRAEIMGPDDKRHSVFMQPKPNGYAKTLPFKRTAEATCRALTEPLYISVDKVKWMKVAGFYQEHMVLKGKPQRIIATRLVDGPVELFNHTQVEQVVVPIPGVGLAAAAVAGAVVAGTMLATNAGGIVERHWYLRRNDELVKVSRANFMEQLTAYFQDDAEVVAALQRGQVRYPDMVVVVESYNRHKAAAPAGSR